MKKKKNMKRSTAVRKNVQPRETGVKVNNNYKDMVFRLLFKDKERLLGLYNALSGRHYRNPDRLEIVTLESAVYIGMKNDLAFLIDMNLYLFEHQSTVNENMPLGFLHYVSAEYEKLTVEDNLYKEKAVRIPAPHFMVFYNGTKFCKERQELKLSDAFWTVEEKPELELRVQVLNINTGYNEELKEQCQILREYMQYVNKVRGYTEEMSIEKAVDQAVDECIRQGILKKFLLENKAEVRRMSIFEFDEEAYRRAIKEDAYEDGFLNGKTEGKIAGEIEGRIAGEMEGKIAGRIEGRIEDILLCLEDLGTVPDKLQEEIRSETDEGILKKWLKSAARAESIDEFIEEKQKTV